MKISIAALGFGWLIMQLFKDVVLNADVMWCRIVLDNDHDWLIYNI
jgi:hypothetical protein